MIDIDAIFVAFAFQLDLESFLTLYSVSKAFHAKADRHALTLYQEYARQWAPEAAFFLQLEAPPRCGGARLESRREKLDGADQRHA